MDISNASSLRSVLSTAVMDGTVEIKDEKVGIAVVVDKNGPKVYIVDAKGRIAKKSTKVKGTVQLSGTGLEDIRIKSRRMDWYAVVVYGNGSSWYYEGNGTVKLKEENRREWGEIE